MMKFITAIILCLIPSFSAIAETRFYCSGLNGYELLAKKQNKGEVIKKDVTISVDDVEYVFILSDDKKSLNLSINKTGIIEPADRIHQLTLIDSNNSKIIATDNMFWLFVLFPEQKSALYIYTNESKKFNETKGSMLYADCIVK